jgi:outer membrane protein
VEEVTNIALKPSGDGRLALVLKGGAELKASAQTRGTANEIWVDFPKLSKIQLAPVIEQIQLEDPLVSGVKLVPLPKSSGTRLVLKTRQPVKLAEVNESREAQIATINLAVAAVSPAELEKAAALAEAEKRAADPKVKAALAKALAGIELREVKGNLEVVLLGAAVSETKAEILDAPSRLVVEVAGVSKASLEELVSGLRSTSPLFLGARVGKSSKTSTQLVLDLAKSAHIVSRNHESPPDQQQRLVFVLDAGTAEEAAARIAQSQQAEKILQAQAAAEPLGSIRPIRPLSLGTAATNRQARTAAISGDLDLLQFMDKALSSDSKYLAARASYEATSESVPQARAGLLPTATFDYQRTNTHQDALSTAPGSTLTTRAYPIRANTLTLTQPIIKVPAALKLQQAKILESQARVGLIAAEQDLMVRVATAYLTYLAAQDNMDLSKTEREALEQQAQLARTRLNSGLGTVTQMQDTEGRLALAQAREVEAGNKLEDARSGVKEILGVEVKKIKGFPGDFDAAMPQPAAVDLWVDAALEQNLSLQAQNMAVEIAALEVRRQHAGHYPTLNLVATASNTNQGDALVGGNFVGGSNVKSRDIAVKLSIPLFEGGMTSSLERESIARQEKTLQERDQEYRKTERLARSSMLGVVSGAQTLGALRKALVAQQSALQTRQEGLNSGIYSVVQVADAFRLYFAAKRDYLQARYDYLLNRLRLKQAVGSLSRSDLDDIAQLLK